MSRICAWDCELGGSLAVQVVLDMLSMLSMHAKVSFSLGPIIGLIGYESQYGALFWTSWTADLTSSQPKLAGAGLLHSSRTCRHLSLLTATMERRDPTIAAHALLVSCVLVNH